MADKTLSIKGATDEELDALFLRLRKENEVQRIVRDIIELSREPKTDLYGNRIWEPVKVSTEVPVDTMYHFGIKGMKWGVRRKRGPDGRILEGQIQSEDYQKSRDLKKKKVSAMSNAELKSVNERSRLEKEFADLNKKKMSAGQKIVTDILLEVGKEAAKGYLRDQLKKKK